MWLQKCDLCIKRDHPCSEPRFPGAEPDTSSTILHAPYPLGVIHSIFNTKATTDMAFTAQPWAGNGEDKGSSSGNERRYGNAKPISREMLRETCAHLSRLLKLIDSFVTINQCAINSAQNSTTLTTMAGVGAWHFLHITLGQAVDLEFISSQMESLILSVSGKADVPMGDLAWNEHGRGVSRIIHAFHFWHGLA